MMNNKDYFSGIFMNFENLKNSKELKNNENRFDIITISDSEFELLRQLIYDNFGINLNNKKRNLVVGRLQRFIKEKYGRGVLVDYSLFSKQNITLFKNHMLYVLLFTEYGSIYLTKERLS